MDLERGWGQVTAHHHLMGRWTSPSLAEESRLDAPRDLDGGVEYVAWQRLYECTSNRNLELGSQTILSVQHGTASVPLGPKIVSRIRSHNNHFARVVC